MLGEPKIRFAETVETRSWESLLRRPRVICAVLASVLLTLCLRSGLRWRRRARRRAPDRLTRYMDMWYA